MTLFWIIYIIGAVISYIIATHYIVRTLIEEPFPISHLNQCVIYTVGLQIVFSLVSWLFIAVHLRYVIPEKWPTVKAWFKKVFLNIRLTLKYWWILIIDIPL